MRNRRSSASYASNFCSLARARSVKLRGAECRQALLSSVTVNAVPTVGRVAFWFMRQSKVQRSRRRRQLIKDKVSIEKHSQQGYSVCCGLKIVGNWTRGAKPSDSAEVEVEAKVDIRRERVDASERGRARVQGSRGQTCGK
jgi:hypothetical protein